MVKSQLETAAALGKLGDTSRWVEVLPRSVARDPLEPGV